MVRTNPSPLSKTPEFLTLIQRQTTDKPFASATIIIVEIDKPLHNGGCRIALTHLDRPQDPRATIRPRAHETSLLGDTVSIRPSELRPIGGKKEGVEEKDTARKQIVSPVTKIGWNQLKKKPHDFDIITRLTLWTTLV
jgi:hypothetical protein